MEKIICLMQKNSPENFSPLEVDNVTGEFYVKVPEWVVNDMNWYEDTEVHFKVDGKEVIVTEKD